MSTVGQLSQGYRQLASFGPTQGPELNTAMCIAAAVVLGLLSGTFLAGESWFRLNAHSSQPIAQRNQGISTPQIQPPATVLQASVPTNTPPQANAHSGNQRAGASAALAVMLPVNEHALASLKSALGRTAPTAQAPAKPTAVPASSRVVVSHKHHFAHRLTSWIGQTAGSVGLFHHRLASPRTTEVDGAMPVELGITNKFPGMNPASTFTAEGEVRVASFDATAGIIETYEGESFSLDKTLVAANEPRVSDMPANVHYVCDQFWNCSLMVAGQMVSNAKRTR